MIFRFVWFIAYIFWLKKKKKKQNGNSRIDGSYLLSAKLGGTNYKTIILLQGIVMKTENRDCGSNFLDSSITESIVFLKH